MNKRVVAYIAVTGIVAAGAGFWGGTAYQKSRISRIKGMTNGLPFMQGEQGNRTFGQFRMVGTAGRGAQNAGVVMGEIISKDEKSLTVKLPDGGSKIVFFSSSTEVGKTATTTPEFLSTGQSIVASGSANSDGSINAQNIQVRPRVDIISPQK